MDELPYIDDASVLAERFRHLADAREAGKHPGGKANRRALNREEREQIWQKTDGRCHICGGDVSVERFEADHVKNHTSGGSSYVENFLPSCRTCNGHRWHYSAEELQWILKIGIWAKTQMANETRVGKTLLADFIKFETVRERRRKSQRAPMGIHPGRTEADQA